MKNIADELFVQRCVVLIETEPQSNKYQQVAFTPEQFKKFSFHLDSLFEKVEMEGLREDMAVTSVTLNDLEIPLPDNIDDFYE